MFGATFIVDISMLFMCITLPPEVTTFTVVVPLAESIPVADAVTVIS